MQDMEKKQMIKYIKQNIDNQYPYRYIIYTYPVAYK